MRMRSCFFSFFFIKARTISVQQIYINRGGQKWKVKSQAKKLFSVSRIVTMNWRKQNNKTLGWWIVFRLVWKTKKRAPFFVCQLTKRGHSFLMNIPVSASYYNERNNKKKKIIINERMETYFFHLNQRWKELFLLKKTKQNKQPNKPKHSSFANSSSSSSSCVFSIRTTRTKWVSFSSRPD